MNKNIARRALAVMIDAYQGDLDRLAEYMIDYCDDPAIENSPALIDAMEILAPDEEITALLETIDSINTDLAAMIAELCRSCFSDIDNCDC